MKTLVRRILIASMLVGCEGPPEPFCGGIEDPLIYELTLTKLTLDIEELVPVVGEICLRSPRDCECVPTDADGVVRVEVPREAELLAEVNATGYVGTLVVHTSGVEDRFSSLRVIDRATLSIIAGTVGERVDRTRGQVALRIAPAEGADVSGAVVVLTNLDTGEEHPVIYAADGIPSLEATSTDDSGIVFAMNLEPGRYEFTSPALASCGVVDAGWPRRDAEGRLLALGFEIRANYVTLIDALRCFGDP